ncbi:D-methionine transport system ATP-binding protein [Barrientosiimonas humi]|uniref:D-methionine transport system ATP-binding protein n=1 Tax=Barrientosiimonas humi TaxID=999931 RepID=A0A542X8H6_9MICO|nr:ATP-binding cassette domain-containing protein [Barrientosiimonas humi]TQL32143.1 D-methionine transport system ATP-binding protein [Barrientosiimonas humi]CAG7572131.1 Methionine import ATP-binding protein MetN 2 [Barrientosiimonas humi]
MSESIISLDRVGKTFSRGGSQVTALDEVTLDVRRGEVFAVIGFSGAGKSTLVRLINGLELPTSGTVTVQGQQLNSLRPKQIRALRSDIGMVFQQFNLLRSRTVYGNVAYPLEVAGWKPEQIYRRITELLHFVGLTERAWAYPEELSGGQKQRVGIARALATNPPILLADESTSALDPDTTREVLALLRRVNEELGITIVVITHEMEVVRSLADRVAVLESGRLAELGPVRDIFANPTAGATRRLVGATLDAVPDADDLAQLRARHRGRIVTVTVAAGRSLGAVLGRASEQGVELEIVHGGLTSMKEESLATFTLSLRGEPDAVERMVAELRGIGAVEEAGDHGRTAGEAGEPLQEVSA